MPLAQAADIPSVSSLMTSGGSSEDLGTVAYGIFTNLQTDFSVFLLSQVFGSVGNILQGTGSELSSTLLSYFNIGVWVVAGGILAYTITIGSLRIGQEGRFMGEAFNISSLIRSMLGIGILIPQFNGLSLIQALVIWAVIQGVNLANGVWGSVLSYAGQIGGAGSVGGITLQTQASEEDMKRTLVSMAQLLRSEVCFSLVQAYDTNSQRTLEPIYDLANKRLIFGTGKHKINPKLDNWGLCGVYTWAVDDNKLGENYENAKLEALRQVDYMLRPVAKRIADRALNKKKIVDASEGRLLCNDVDSPSCIPCLNSDFDALQQGDICPESTALISAMSTYLKLMQASRLSQIEKITGGYKGTIGWVEDAYKAGWIMAGAYHYRLMETPPVERLLPSTDYISTFDAVNPRLTRPPYITLAGDKKPKTKKNTVIADRFVGQLEPATLKRALRTICDPNPSEAVNTAICDQDPTTETSKKTLVRNLENVTGYLNQASTMLGVIYNAQWDQFDWSDEVSDANNVSKPMPAKKAEDNKGKSKKELRKEKRKKKRQDKRESKRKKKEKRKKKRKDKKKQRQTKRLEKKNKRLRRKKHCIQGIGSCQDKLQKARQSLSLTYQEYIKLDDKAFMRLVSRELQEKAKTSKNFFTKAVGAFLINIWNAWVSLSSGSGAGSVKDPKVHEKSFLTSLIPAIFKPKPDRNLKIFFNDEFGNPLYNLREFGMTLIAASTRFIIDITHQIFSFLFGGAAATSVAMIIFAGIGGSIIWVGDHLMKSGWFFLIGALLRMVGFAIREGMFLPHLIYQIVMAWAFMYLPFIIALVTPVLLLGILTMVYIPLLPYFIFTFAAVGWLILVLEAIVASPLVALGLAHPQGHDYLGRAEIGLILLLSVFIRPAMMILGLVIGMLLLIIFMPFFNSTFYWIFKAVIISFIRSDYSYVLLWVGSIAMMLLYVSISMALVRFSYSTIYSLPDRILRWIGGQSEESTVSTLINELLGRFTQTMSYLASGGASMISSVRGMKIAPDGFTGFFQGVGAVMNRKELGDNNDDD